MRGGFRKGSGRKVGSKYGEDTTLTRVPISLKNIVVNFILALVQAKQCGQLYEFLEKCGISAK